MRSCQSVICSTSISNVLDSLTTVVSDLGMSNPPPMTSSVEWLPVLPQIVLVNMTWVVTSAAFLVAPVMGQRALVLGSPHGPLRLDPKNFEHGHWREGLWRLEFKFWFGRFLVYWACKPSLYLYKKTNTRISPLFISFCYTSKIFTFTLPSKLCPSSIPE